MYKKCKIKKKKIVLFPCWAPTILLNVCLSVTVEEKYYQMIHRNNLNVSWRITFQFLSFNSEPIPLCLWRYIVHYCARVCVIFTYLQVTFYLGSTYWLLGPTAVTRPISWYCIFFSIKVGFSRFSIGTYLNQNKLGNCHTRRHLMIT